jgi:hypothetical protein
MLLGQDVEAPRTTLPSLKIPSAIRFGNHAPRSIDLVKNRPGSCRLLECIALRIHADHPILCSSLILSPLDDSLLSARVCVARIAAIRKETDFITRLSPLSIRTESCRGRQARSETTCVCRECDRLRKFRTVWGRAEAYSVLQQAIFGG